MRNFVDRKTLISVYNDIIHPYFTYCCKVRDVFGVGWETLKVQRLKSKAKMMLKILHHLEPPPLKKLFNLKKESLQHNLRDSSNTLRLLKPRSNSMKKSFMYDGASTWNSIPEIIRDSKRISNFEKKISPLSLKN